MADKLMKKNKNPIYFGTGASLSKDYDSLYMLINTAMEGGIRHFDTAPSYATEEVLGKLLHSLASKHCLSRKDYFIQTKIDPWQMQEGEIRRFVDDNLKKMKIDYLDSLLIHWFVPDYFDSTWLEFNRLYEEGIVKKIGVCNVRERHINRLLSYDIPPQIIQIERNPLRVCLGEINI